MLQRRRYGRGAIYLRRGKKQSVWYGRWWEDNTTVEGKLVRRYRKVRLGTFTELPTKNQARDALSRHLQPGAAPRTAVTFAELAQRWEKVHERTLKSSTFAHYKHTLRSLQPVFGTSEITDISRHAVEHWVLDQARNYSRATVRSARTTLSIVLGWAMDNGWLEKNPVKGVKLPRRFGGRTITRTVLDPGQVFRLAESLEEPVATLVILLYSTGLRIGEAAGLRWSDLVGQVLHVRRRIYDRKVDDTKTRGSNRQLPLSPELVGRLGKLRTSEGDDWIFRSRAGSPFNPGNWLKRYLHPAAEKIGVQLSGWHDLRCSLTTNLRRQGAHPKIVSAILGHSRVQLALDTYDLASVEELALPLAMLSGQLNPSEPKTKSEA